MGLQLVQLYYNTIKWHFEDRTKKNGKHPTYRQVKQQPKIWTQLPKSQSIYHDNKVGKPEKKFVATDGREAVFDGDTLQPVTDPRYIATYNYCPVYQVPQDNPQFLDYYLTCATGIGHFFADMLPYYLTGCSNTREQFEEKISIFS